MPGECRQLYSSGARGWVVTYNIMNRERVSSLETGRLSDTRSLIRSGLQTHVELRSNAVFNRNTVPDRPTGFRNRVVRGTEIFTFPVLDPRFRYIPYISITTANHVDVGRVSS